MAAGDNGNSVSANFTGISSAGAAFDQSVQDLETALKKVNTTIDGLRSDWSGQGHLSFDSVITKWHTDVTTMNQTLEEISKNLKDSNQVYQDVEAAIKKSFSGFGD